MTGPSTIDGFAWRDVYYDDDLATGANDGTSEADAWQSLADMIAGARGGDRVNMKKAASAVTLGASVTFPADTGGCIWFRGYGTTPGDGTRWQADTSTFGILGSASGPQMFSDLHLTGATTSNVLDVQSKPNTWVFNCRLESTSTGFCIGMNNSCVAGCTIINNDTYVSAAGALSGSGLVIGNQINSEGIVATCTISDESDHLFFFKNCVISDSLEARNCLNLSDNFNENGYAFVGENSFWGGLNGINIVSLNTVQEASQAMIANVVSGCGTGINMAATTKEWGSTQLNAVGNNTTNDYLAFSNLEDVIDKVTLTANPYSSTTTLALNDTAGGGALCRDGGTTHDLGGNRHGNDDYLPSPGLVAGNSVGGGGGLLPTDFGLIMISDTSEII